MPRFLHAADLHLDSPLQGLAKLEGAPIDRLRGATRRAFERLVDVAIQEEVAFVVLVGDVFDTNPAVHSAQFLIRQLERLSRAGIEVIAVLGNHDFRGLFPPGLVPPPNVKVLSHAHAETHRVELSGVAIHGRSYPVQHPDADLSDSYPAPIAGWLNVGLLHTALEGSPDHAPYAPVTSAALAKKGYQYWALGHVHKAATVEVDGVPIVFPGNLQGRHAKETGPKGCVIVEFEGAKVVAVKDVSLDAVRWHEVRVDVSAAAGWGDVAGLVASKVERALQGSVQAGRLDVVRAVLVGASPIVAELEGHLADVEDDVRRRVQAGGAWLERLRSELTVSRNVTDPAPSRSQLEQARRELTDDAGALSTALLEISDALGRSGELRDRIADRLMRDVSLTLPKRGVPLSREVVDRVLDRAVALVDARLSGG